MSERIPVARISTEVLDVLGLPVKTDNSTLKIGVCDFLLNGAIWQITYECASIFALLILIDPMINYPTSSLTKVQDILLGLPAF